MYVTLFWVVTAGQTSWNVIKAAPSPETSVFNDKTTYRQKPLHPTPEFSEHLEFQLNTATNSHHYNKVLTKCDNISVNIQRMGSDCIHQHKNCEELYDWAT